MILPAASLWVGLLLTLYDLFAVCFAIGRDADYVATSSQSIYKGFRIIKPILRLLGSVRVHIAATHIRDIHIYFRWFREVVLDRHLVFSRIGIHAEYQDVIGYFSYAGHKWRERWIAGTGAQYTGCLAQEALTIQIHPLRIICGSIGLVSHCTHVDPVALHTYLVHIQQQVAAFAQLRILDVFVKDLDQR